MATLVQIVVTPGSGDGRAVAIAREVRKRLGKEGYAARLHAFRTLDELVQWAKTCRAAFSSLVAIGGDATVSAAAEAAIRLWVPFVPVPSGFGNLFTNALEHPSDPDEVVALLGRGDLVWSDVGVASGEMFLAHRSYGYLARIQEDVERLHRPRQRYRRLLSYYQMAARQLSDGALDAIQVEIDGHAGASGASRIRARASSSTRIPSAIHTTWRSRLRRLKASPAWAPSPSAAKAAVFAPSSAPRLPGTKKVAKRTAEPSVSITRAIVSDAGIWSTRRKSQVSSAPMSQPSRWKLTESANRRHWLR